MFKTNFVFQAVALSTAMLAVCLCAENNQPVGAAGINAQPPHQGASLASYITIEHCSGKFVHGEPVHCTVVMSYANNVLPVGGITMTDQDGTVGSAVLDTRAVTYVHMSTLKAGRRMLVAAFPGGGIYRPSRSTPYPVDIARGEAIVRLSCPGAGYPGESLTCTATVLGTESGDPPTGTVTYTSSGGTASAQIVRGTAYLQPALPQSAGTATVTVSYAGDTNYKAATSSPHPVAVAKIAASVSIVPEDATHFDTTPVTINVVLRSSSAAPIGGAVTLTENGSMLGSGTVDAAGRGRIVIPRMAAGAHTITANYAGNTAHDPAVSGALQLEVRATPVITITSAASGKPAIAPDSLVSIFGNGLASATVTATLSPPVFELAGVTVNVEDAAGRTWPAQLQFVSPSQINLLLPAQVGVGVAKITIPGAPPVSGTATVGSFAPGLFSADGRGSGPVAAYAISRRQDGSLEEQPAFTCERSVCRVALIRLDESRETVLVLYGTGIRNGTGIKIRVGPHTIDPIYVGAHAQFPGLDQVNALLPADLAGAGELDLELVSGAIRSNTVRVGVQ